MDGTKSIFAGAVHGTGATGIRSAMALLRLSAEWKQSCLRLRHLSWSGCFREEEKTAVVKFPRFRKFDHMGVRLAPRGTIRRFLRTPGRMGLAPPCRIRRPSHYVDLPLSPICLAPKRARLVFVRETGICECNRPFQEMAGRSPKSKACFLLVTSSTSRLKPARLLSTLLLISLLEAAVVGRGCLKAKKAHRLSP